MPPARLARRRVNGTHHRPHQTAGRRENTGLSVDTYQAAYQAMTGIDVLPGRRQLVVGRLANLGIVNGQKGTPTLTDVAQESFIS